MIDVLGADHGGYVKRMKAAVKAMTRRQGRRSTSSSASWSSCCASGEPVKMSKRSGDFVTLREVVEEVGRDAVRFMMLMRKNDAPLDFDLAKVIEQSKDNPVFYVQYAHARCRSTFRQPARPVRNWPMKHFCKPPISSCWRTSGEIAILKRLAQYPRMIEQAAAAHEPHRVAFYLYELASEFHAHWNRGKDLPHLRFVRSGEPSLTQRTVGAGARRADSAGVGARLARCRRSRGNALTVMSSGQGTSRICEWPRTTMSEVFKRRSTVAMTGARTGIRGGGDPLAELARIVGAEDPFANLFDDARRPVPGQDGPQPAPGYAQRPLQEPTFGLTADPHLAAERDMHPPEAVELRGAYDGYAQRPRDEFDPFDDRYPAGRRPPARVLAAADEDGPYEDAAGYPDELYALDADDDLQQAHPQRLQSRRRSWPGARMAVTLIGLAVIGTGAGMAWNRGLFEGAGLPGTRGTPPVILADGQPTKVKPAAPAPAIASAKDIFDRVGHAKTDTPDTLVPREELPVAIDPTSTEAAASDLAAPKPASRPVRSISVEPDGGPAGAAPQGGRRVQVASADPLPPGSLSPEPRRVRTVKVLADGTVVTGDAAGAPLGSVRGIQGGDAQSGIPSLALAPTGADGEDGDAADRTSSAGALSTFPSEGEGAGDQESAEVDAAPGTFAAGPGSEDGGASKVLTALPPARPKTIPAQATIPARATTAAQALNSHSFASQADAPPAPARQQVASLQPASAATPAGSLWVVQIASTKSQADANTAYQGLQRRLPSLFAGVKPTIKRADLGDKGTFYRLRVGGWSSRDAATAFCTKLKASGRDCVVAHN